MRARSRRYQSGRHTHTYRWTHPLELYARVIAVVNGAIGCREIRILEQRLLLDALGANVAEMLLGYSRHSRRQALLLLT